MTGTTLAHGDMGLVRDVSLSAAPGELLALLGPSGLGKTSLLRVITGFLPFTTGEIRFDGTRVNELLVEERRLGMVFRERHLFPALTVYRNLETCLTGTVAARVTAAEAAACIAGLLPALGLTGLEARFPAELSSGQRRRVVLTRALLVRPRFLLLNEPFTGLDASLRRELTELLRREQHSRRLTTVFVTHNEEDATRATDSIARFCDTAGTRGFRQAPLQRLRLTEKGLFRYNRENMSCQRHLSRSERRTE